MSLPIHDSLLHGQSIKQLDVDGESLLYRHNKHDSILVSCIRYRSKLNNFIESHLFRAYKKFDKEKIVS